MTITEQIIDTETADGPMAIVHASPEGGSLKRVLIFMDAPGIRPSLKHFATCLLYTSPSPRDLAQSRMPSSA